MACPGRDTHLRHAPVWTHSVLRHDIVGTQLFDMPWLRYSLGHALAEHSFKTCPSWNAVIRHALDASHFMTCLVGTQFYDMP